ncbi:hypothetical protein SAMN04489708_12126 [Paracidovorax cattleyae]|uniref:Uncharacterized protein n=1 Tax=Paracidovorax cattleyae TaxID=80868 RepID=A0A1H0UPY7_9BURK|nr:hypothetical protein SAMN04489708_12126 [Paracidovorax cattleyae]
MCGYIRPSLAATPGAATGSTSFVSEPPITGIPAGPLMVSFDHPEVSAEGTWLRKSATEAASIDGTLLPSPAGGTAEKFICPDA